MIQNLKRQNLKRTIRRFLKDRQGSVALEAAISFPILAVMLLASIEFTQAYIAKRKTEQFAGTVADLVARTTCVTPANLNDISTIGPTIIAPFTASSLGMRISSLAQNGSTSGTVQWSYATGSMSALPTGTNVTVQSGLIPSGQTVIMTETSYSFMPSVSQFLTMGVPLNATSYYSPRLSTAVVLQSSC